MHAKSIGLAWIVVKDIKKAVKFYTDVVGLKLIEMNEEFGWAELEGREGQGMRLGIAQQSEECPSPVNPGQNAVLTFTVDNIDKAIKDMQKQGASFLGKVEVVPGHVKLQTMKDTEGNVFQLVEVLSPVKQHKHEHEHEHKHKSGCCSH